MEAHELTKQLVVDWLNNYASIEDVLSIAKTAYAIGNFDKPRNVTSKNKQRRYDYVLKPKVKYRKFKEYQPTPKKDYSKDQVVGLKYQV